MKQRQIGCESVYSEQYMHAYFLKRVISSQTFASHFIKEIYISCKN